MNIVAQYHVSLRNNLPNPLLYAKPQTLNVDWYFGALRLAGSSSLNELTPVPSQRY